MNLAACQINFGYGLLITLNCGDFLNHSKNNNIKHKRQNARQILQKKPNKPKSLLKNF